MSDELKLLLKKYYEWEGAEGESYKEMYFSRDPFERYEHKFRLNTALNILAVKKNKKVLDLGCAEGFVTYKIAEVSPNVVGMDISNNKLQKAKNLAPQFKPLKQPEFICADANERFPFADSAFDSVLCTEMIEHTPEPEHVLNEIARILMPDGRAVISIPTWSQYSWVHVLTKKNNYKNVNKLNIMVGQFEKPFEGHIWNFTLGGFLALMKKTMLKPVNVKGAVAFDFPFFHIMRSNKTFGRLALKIQYIGDKFLQFVPGFEKYSRYCIIETMKSEEK